MNNKKNPKWVKFLLAGLGFILITVISLWILVPATPISVLKPVITKTDSETLNIVATRVDKQSSTKPVKKMADNPDDNPYMNAAMKAQLMRIADRYEETMKYPAFSQPIKDAADIARYIPDPSSSIELPFPVAGGDDSKAIKASITLKKYQYFHGDPISVSVKLSNVDSGASVSGKIELKGLQGQTLLEQALSNGNQPHSLFTQIQPESTSNTWPAEIQVMAFLDVDGQRLSLSTPIRFDAASAVLQSVAMSEVQGPYLMIPLHFKVNQPGYFFVSANLYTQSGKPIVHLDGESAMTSLQNTMTLKAHIAALEVSKDEGPYLLKDVSIVRSAQEGEKEDVAGRSEQVQYPVEGYAFNTYQQTAYQDPQVQERVAFLRKMGKL